MKKKKKKIKPGYKKEIQRAIIKDKQQKTKANKRQQLRQQRKNRKKNSEY